MNIRLLGFILSSVALSAIAQLLLKLGMSGATVQQAFGQSQPLEAAWTVATNPWVIAGLVLYALGAVVWLAVLAQAELSFAYPFVGVGFIFTMILGWSVLGESLGAARLTGTLLVVSGVWLISKS
jgi:multidrug transporter EmrE-like cation transporter